MDKCFTQWDWQHSIGSCKASEWWFDFDKIPHLGAVTDPLHAHVTENVSNCSLSVSKCFFWSSSPVLLELSQGLALAGGGDCCCWTEYDRLCCSLSDDDFRRETISWMPLLRNGLPKCFFLPIAFTSISVSSLGITRTPENLTFTTFLSVPLFLHQNISEYLLLIRTECYTSTIQYNQAKMKPKIFCQLNYR